MMTHETSPSESTENHTNANATPWRAQARNLEGLRVVIADSEDAQRKMLKGILESEGAQVVELRDCAEAIALLFDENARDEATDLLILDGQAPDVVDLQAVHRLRDGGFRRPIIAVGRPTRKRGRSDYIQSGYDDFLPKPISRDVLTAITRICRGHKS